MLAVRQTRSPSTVFSLPSGSSCPSFSLPPCCSLTFQSYLFPCMRKGMFYLSFSACPISLKCGGDLQLHSFPAKLMLDQKCFFSKPFVLTLTPPFKYPRPGIIIHVPDFLQRLTGRIIRHGLCHQAQKQSLLTPRLEFEGAPSQSG